MFIPGYAVGIWLGQVYLQEVLDHLCSLYLLLFLQDIDYFCIFLWNDITYTNSR